MNGLRQRGASFIGLFLFLACLLAAACRVLDTSLYANQNAHLLPTGTPTRFGVTKHASGFPSMRRWSGDRLAVQQLIALEPQTLAGHVVRNAALQDVSSPSQVSLWVFIIPVLIAAAGIWFYTEQEERDTVGMPLQGEGLAAQRASCKSALLEAIQRTNCGASATPTQAADVDFLATSLAEMNPTPAPTDGPLQGNYTLIYTTEKAIHPFLRLQAFGIPAPDVGQQVQLDQRRVFNRIEFWGGNAIRAEGPLKVASPNRIKYRFEKVTASIFGIPIRVQLKAGGWTETRYLDDDLRIVRNSQGDLLIMRRIEDVEEVPV